jgi:hypothetical protein
LHKAEQKKDKIPEKVIIVKPSKKGKKGKKEKIPLQVIPAEQPTKLNCKQKFMNCLSCCQRKPAAKSIKSPEKLNLNSGVRSISPFFDEVR